MKKVSVWMELNDSMGLGWLHALDYKGIKPDELVREYGVRTAEEWRRVGIDDFYLTTNKWGIGPIYDYLIDKELHGKVAGGIKGHNYFSLWSNRGQLFDLESEGAWRNLTRACRNISYKTGDRRVIIDNETVLLPYWGQSAIRYDMQKVSEASSPLCNGGVIPYFWSPRFLEESQLGVELTMCLARIPHAKFIVDYQGYGVDGWKYHKRRGLYSEMRSSIGQQHLVEILYVTEDGYFHTHPMEGVRVYNPRELKQYLDSRSEGEYLIYPGPDSLPVARMWAHL